MSNYTLSIYDNNSKEVLEERYDTMEQALNASDYAVTVAGFGKLITKIVENDKPILE